jgi:hypothetical protein
MREWVQKLREFDIRDLKTSDRLPALRMTAVFDLIARWGPKHEYEVKSLMAASESMTKLTAVDARLEVWFQGL